MDFGKDFGGIVTPENTGWYGTVRSLFSICNDGRRAGNNGCQDICN